MFGNTLLDRGEGRLLRCLETECRTEERAERDGVSEQRAG